MTLIRLSKKWAKYIGNEFIAYTDNKNIEYMFNRKDLNKLNVIHQRWLLELSQKRIYVRHIAGIINAFPDYLSRDIEWDNVI